MGWFGRKDPRPTVLARAYVVPGNVGNLGENINNLSTNGEAKTFLRLVVSSTADARPGAPGQQEMTVHMSNWLRVILEHAGTNYGPNEQLPAEIHLPVQIDAESRRIVHIDVDQAEVELQSYRDVAKRFWLETEAPLAPVRAAMQLPGVAVREGKGLLREWRQAVRELRGDLRDHRAAEQEAARTGVAPKPVLKGPAWSPKEVEQARRTATALRYQLQRNPSQHAQVRASALQAGPMMAAGVRDGARHPEDFEHWLMFEETSGSITAEEAAAYRAAARPPH
jgi:hypothetical protein